MAETRKESLLEHNIAVHNKIAKKYEATHGEIYNDIEQFRLRHALEVAISCVETGSSPRIALDFGCGAGNITQHLTDLGYEVIAADVSMGFLELVASRLYKKNVSTLRLNGLDLTGVPDSSVDIVATYSVLHHVPEYLSLMKEFARVLKPGGVLYIDHEASDALWKSGELSEFKASIKKNSKVDIGKYFVATNYVDRFMRMFIDPKYQREGDIHVFPDDHIEWNKIRNELSTNGIRVVREEDYLLYRRNYDKETYELWKDRVGDMHLLIARKVS
jgi:ubiquinone/menaquinone biosynthesis C-methylase UbiE